jgi:hypothetical protein
MLFDHCFQTVSLRKKEDIQCIKPIYHIGKIKTIKEWNVIQEFYETYMANKNPKMKSVLNLQFQNPIQDIGNYYPFFNEYLSNLLASHNISYHSIYMIELWRYRCFGDSISSYLGLHKDNDFDSSKQFYTCIFYLRKDRSLQGGVLNLYDSNKKFYTSFDPEEKDYLLFDGNVYHKVSTLKGFGIRDCIVILLRL